MFTTTIETLRLELRPFQSDDLDHFWKIGPSNYEIACDTFSARVLSKNSPSHKLLKTLGFEPVGVCLRYSKPLHQNLGNIIMHLPKDRFEALQGDAHVRMGAAQ